MRAAIVTLAMLLALGAGSAAAAAPGGVEGGFGAALARVILLRDHNTRVVVAGTMLLGVASGVLGTYMLLRRRALVGDALGHATLPGIVAAFLVMAAAGGSGKALPGLLVGAAAGGVLGVGALAIITRTTRVKQDAALGIVISVFFGLGVALLRVAQKMSTGNQAGLESFIYGKTASMVQADAVVLGVCAIVAVAACLLLAKEFAILSFDPDFAGAQGWPVGVLDAIMMALVVAVTVAGLQAVGLILIVAMLIIPAAAARFWTDRLPPTLAVAAAIGAASAFVGTVASALFADMPAGAIIVTAAACAFVVSLLLGPKGGAILRLVHRVRLERSVARTHLLRALFEWRESRGGAATMTQEALLAQRAWSKARLRGTVGRARRAGLVRTAGADAGAVALTEEGAAAAARIVRRHRLWEHFLVAHADVAPSHVDRDADQIEHVLGPEMMRELEALLERETAAPPVPPSPHALAREEGERP
jgi:manganese/zinc/iron transport system permease protein